MTGEAPARERGLLPVRDDTQHGFGTTRLDLYQEALAIGAGVVALAG